jgi:transcriptional regulator with XRE-family HTH domain
MQRLGDRVKFYRKRKGLTRKQLAENLCDESTIFRLEKSKQFPRLEILKEISEKLEIPLHTMLFPHDFELTRLKKLCRELTYYEDFTALELALEKVESIISENIDFSYSQRDTRKFIDWHWAIILHKHHNDLEEALKQLSNLVQTELTMNEIDIGILNSIGLIYLDMNKRDQALKYFKLASDSLEDVPIIEDLTLNPRIRYNYAFVLYYTNELDIALQVAFDLLYYLKANHLNYCLGEILHMLGTILKSKQKYSEALSYFLKSLAAFQLEDSSKNITVVKKSIEEVKNIVKR